MDKFVMVSRALGHIILSVISICSSADGFTHILWLFLAGDQRFHVGNNSAISPSGHFQISDYSLGQVSRMVRYLDHILGWN